MKRKWLRLVPILFIGVLLCAPRLRESAAEFVQPYVRQLMPGTGQNLGAAAPLPGNLPVLPDFPDSSEAAEPAEEIPAETPAAAVQPPDSSEGSIPYLSTRYYISHLPEQLRGSFARLYASAAAFEASCRLSPDEAGGDGGGSTTPGISSADAELLMMVLIYDCPELFQVSRSAEYQIWTVNGRVVEIEIPYAMSREVYEEQLEECEGMIRSIGTELKDLSDAEKERRVYDILADSVAYESEEEESGTAYGALILHRAKCDGISLAMKWLMDSQGIPSLVLSGREDPNPRGHAWNSVMIDGKYRDVDVTNDTQEEEKLTNLYGAYNVDRSWIASIYPLNGVIDEYYDIPQSVGMEESFHVKNGSFAPEGTPAEDALFALYARAYAEGGLSRIQFEADEDYRRFLESFEDNTQNWFRTNFLGGSVQLSSLDAFRTVAVRLELD